MRDTQPTLPTDRAHDLPPRWDGHVVVWDGWEPAADRPMFICPPPKEPDSCTACGSLARPMRNKGRVADSAITAHAMIDQEDARRALLPPELRHKIPRRAFYRLVAHRCPDCRHDRVLEDLTTWWDLDESDYTDDGSFDA